MPDLSDNPFEHAPFIRQLKEHKTAVILDYDRTVTTGNRNPNQEELRDQEDIWRIIDEANAVDGCISARTPAMMMCSRRYVDSVQKGFTEPLPRLYKNEVTGTYEYRDPATMPFFKNAVNRKIIGSLGWGILVQDGDGYRLDKTYGQMLSVDAFNQDASVPTVKEVEKILDRSPVEESVTPSAWRLAAMTFVFLHCLQFRQYLAPIESLEKYLAMKTDVAPLPYRLQFDFVGTAGLMKMLELKQIIKRQRQKVPANLFALRIHTIDESCINKEEPEQSRYTLYLVPWHGRKENMFNRMTKQSADSAHLKPGELNLFYAGDSPTDFKIGLWGGGDSETKFVLPCGSHLAPYLIGRHKEYGVVDLSILWENPAIKRSKPRLVPTGRSGEYRFVHKVRGGRNNTVVIADERYPGLSSPGSVATFLEEYLLNKKRHAGH